MSTLRTWTEVTESKRGAEALLAKALETLRADTPGVTSEAIRDALANLLAATIALRGCENAVEKLMHAALRVPDVRALARGDGKEAA